MNETFLDPLVPASLTLRLTIDGQDMTEHEDIILVGLRLERQISTPVRLNLRFELSKTTVESTRWRDMDVSLSVKGTPLFDGTVTGGSLRIDGTGPRLELTCTDAMARLHLSRHLEVRSYRGLHDFVAVFADRAGLSFVGKGTPDPSIGRHVSRFETDHQFLTATLARFGFGYGVRENTVYLIDLTEHPKDISLDLGHTSAITLLEERWSGEVIASEDFALQGWCPEQDRTLGKHQRGNPGALGQATRADEPVDRLRAARAAEHALSGHALLAEASGLLDLHPGDVVQAPSGMRHPLGSVEIRVDGAGGLSTRISSVSLAPPPKAEPTGAAVYTGSVHSVSDPTRAGRVRVDLAGFGDLSTGWLPVLGNVGAETGLAMPFNKGDPVLVVAPEGDPELGLVLGGVLRAGGAHGDLVQGGKRNAMALRADGATVELDEARGRLTLALDDGPRVELSAGRIRLSADKSLDLDCSGQVRIRGKRIDFEEA